VATISKARAEARRRMTVRFSPTSRRPDPCAARTWGSR
jgi:hypothetical protein